MDPSPRPAEPHPAARDRNLISSLERGFRVLRVFNQHCVELTPAEVARKSGLPRAAARRVLLTLCSLGYAVSDGKHFRLTPRVLDLAHGYLAKTRVRELIDPIIRAAVVRLKDSCALAVRDGADSITISCWNSPTFGAVNINVGLRVPLYVSTPGRVLLSNLPTQQLQEYFASVAPQRFTSQTITSKPALLKEIERIRERGYALGKEEFEPGVFALAVPLNLHSGGTSAALTLVGNSAKITSQAAIDERVARLIETVAQLRQILPETLTLLSDLRLSGS